MRLRRPVVRRRDPRVLWVAMDDTAPHPYLVASLRRAGTAVRDLHWAMSKNGQRSFGRYVEFGDRTGHEHPMSVKLVSPRMLLEFARAPEDVLITYELGLVGLYAGLSKLFHQHKVISLVEGDYRHIGRAGTAPIKVVVPPVYGAIHRCVRCQQRAGPGVLDPHAERSRGQDHRRLVAGGHAGRPQWRAPRPRRRSPRGRRCSSAPAGSSLRRAPTW